MSVATALTLASLVAPAALAEEAALLSCIKKYTDLGVSADAALAECKKNSLAECVKQLMSGKFVATSIRKSSDGYLIDLGNDESRWMEGKQWKSMGCKAHTKGPYRRQSDQHPSFWSKARSYEWFRQGWCSKEQITLEQPYMLEEAKLKCELSASPPLINDTRGYSRALKEA